MGSELKVTFMNQWHQPLGPPVVVKPGETAPVPFGAIHFKVEEKTDGR